eukprot:gnl/MRDRNA2_/MRDRNA2_100688_c0_seq1.p1 gnl/MRDRNA2_/MRDRNA2_100688_c0~~gnl/MRDRNA2_/MRDRNA2_100688_c0_seq1.p1  ORF type:complete len:592 (-),score=122.50 gnl/MRDRNA2_/MRDRNA2_100688_c0_seq1:79-1854(-)
MAEAEIRFDPETRQKVTYEQLFLDLKDEGWTEDDIRDYWDLDCQSIHSGDSLDDSEFTLSDGTPHSQYSGESHDSWDHHLSGGPAPPELDYLPKDHPSAANAQRYVDREEKAATKIQAIARGNQARASVAQDQGMHMSDLAKKFNAHRNTVKSMAKPALDKKKSTARRDDSMEDYHSDEHHHSDEHSMYSDEGDDSHAMSPMARSTRADLGPSGDQRHYAQDIQKKKKGGGLYIGPKQDHQMKAIREAEDRAARTIQREFKNKHIQETMNVMKQDQVPNAFKRQNKPQMVGPTPSPWHWKTRTPIGNPRKAIASPASWIMLARQRDLKSSAAGTYPLLPEHLQSDKDADTLASANSQTPAEQKIANPGSWQALAKSAPKKKAKPVAPGNEKSFGNFLDTIAAGPKAASISEALSQSMADVHSQPQVQTTTSGASAGPTRSNPDSNFVLIQEEANRVKDLEMRTAQLREKHHRQLDSIGRQRAESTSLHRLSTLGESGLRCHNCDLQLVNVYRLLGGLGSICTYLTLLARDQQGEKLPSQQVDRQMLSILAEALRTVSDIDPEISRLHEFVSSSLANMRPNHSATNQMWQNY